MRPILHLSIPVRDIDEARAFYVDVLGCTAARKRPDFTDIWFYGMQITLQHRPEEVVATGERGCRHFGVTLGREEFDALVARLNENEANWVSEVATDDAGMTTEQTKGKVADPSGNVIELKTYRDVGAALETPPAAD
ncbi:MAG TPA: VOC family protein [Acidimicrobiales bacterium]|nr:VOC family protein [Acidimicrobiales bacterium]